MKIAIDSDSRVISVMEDDAEFIGGETIHVDTVPDGMDFLNSFEWKYVAGEFVHDKEFVDKIHREEEERSRRNAPVLLQTQYISREDFNLLDAQDDHTLYYILEEDGTTTMLKGENR